MTDLIRRWPAGLLAYALALGVSALAASPAAAQCNPQTITNEVGVLGAHQCFVRGQAVAPVPLTDAATITPDFSLSNNFTVTLGGNRTIASPINVFPGQCGFLTLKQDATGSRVPTWGSAWKWSGGTAPTLTTTAAASDLISFCAVTTTVIAAQLAIGNYQ